MIPPQGANAARAAAADLMVQLREYVEPFGRVGWEQLMEAVDLGLPPLTKLPNVAAID